jgi:hypothetical protein
LFTGAAVVGLWLGLADAGRAELVTLRSGIGGGFGTPDTQVNMLVGPVGGPFGAAFTPANFAAARTGPDAFIIQPNGAYTPNLAGDPTSRWIGTNANAGLVEGATALYAIDFVLTQAFTSATLALNFAVDNVLGTGPNQGVFINGTAISGNSSVGSFSSESSLTRNDIPPLLVGRHEHPVHQRR